MRLSDFKVLSFDCYGTLIDWESGMIAALRPLTERVPGLSRNAILQAHALAEAAQERQTPAKPYRELLAIVFKRLAEEWGVTVTLEACVAYGRSVGDWPAFPDTVAALRYLKQFYRLVILSNVDNQSFEATKQRLEVPFDAVVTAEDAGSYKPDPRNFDYMLERLAPMGIKKDEILHTAESLFHDHKVANAAGLASCWIYRRHADEGFGATVDPGERPNVNWTFHTLGELAEAHRREREG